MVTEGAECSASYYVGLHLMELLLWHEEAWVDPQPENLQGFDESLQRLRDQLIEAAMTRPATKVDHIISKWKDTVGGQRHIAWSAAYGGLCREGPEWSVWEVLAYITVAVWHGGVGSVGDLTREQRTIAEELQAVLASTVHRSTDYIVETVCRVAKELLPLGRGEDPQHTVWLALQYASQMTRDADDEPAPYILAALERRMPPSRPREYEDRAEAMEASPVCPDLGELCYLIGEVHFGTPTGKKQRLGKLESRAIWFLLGLHLAFIWFITKERTWG